MEAGPSEEIEQETSLELYKSQLSQVDQAIQAAGASEDLMKLKNDLEELIKLTEDNLLEIKRAKLLKMLGPPVDEEETDGGQDGGDADDEYAAFQAAIAESSNQSSDPKPNDRSDLNKDVTNLNQTGTSNHPGQIRQSDDDNDDDDNCDNDDDEEDDSFVQQQSSSFLELVGTKCRAPFSQEWGDHHYGNAMILSVDDLEHAETMEDCIVHVIFINPIHQSMVPCQYFMEGKCRFSSQDCRSSHGYPVKVSQLHPYLEPDYSKLKESCRCLAKRDGDSVWCQGVVVDVCNDTELNVRFDATKEEDLVSVENVIPLGNDEDDSDSDSDSSDSNEASSSRRVKKTPLDSDDDDDEESEVPVYLWKPLQTTDKLGAWETHTKGIGSKLMEKMGYIHGQGLGRHGDGRAEPVPILLLPPGKSLDKIMELKEMSGNADLFNAMKKLEKRQKMLEKKEALKENQKKKGPTNWGVFGFLNQHLGKGKGGQSHASSSSSADHQSAASSSSESSSLASSSSSSSTVVASAKHSSEKDLTKRSDQEVNVQIFKTAEAIRGVERNLVHLRRQLARNESRDRKMADNIRHKIEQEENNLRKLKSSSQTLETHKERRKAHKKLTVF